jgi:hypothetical protein
MNIDQICALILEQYSNIQQNIKLRNKNYQCSCCKTNSSLTWRPGPVGSGTLCNACGLQYKKSTSRPRMLDMVLVGETATWIKRDIITFEWIELAADQNDPRIMEWKQHEMNKNSFVKSKKRKLIFF